MHLTVTWLNWKVQTNLLSVVLSNIHGGRMKLKPAWYDVSGEKIITLLYQGGKVKNNGPLECQWGPKIISLGLIIWIRLCLALRHERLRVHFSCFMTILSHFRFIISDMTPMRDVEQKIWGEITEYDIVAAGKPDGSTTKAKTTVCVNWLDWIFWSMSSVIFMI